MGAQFVTAVGAFMGTCLGILIQELGKQFDSDILAGTEVSRGLAGTGLQWGDLLLPFTAGRMPAISLCNPNTVQFTLQCTTGTFLYVGTVAVIPELLETGENRKEEIWKTTKQFAAMAAGAGIMLA